MSIQYFKKQRGGVNPVSWEQPHIYKDPPKGIFTRKKETVNVADTMYMLDAESQFGDPTRYNEAIQVFARGQNPMVEVQYQNVGGASANGLFGGAQVSNPYKIEVVRPPITPLEALQPLSAPRMHQNYSVTTNPKIAPQSIATEIDKQVVRSATQTYTNPSGNLHTNLNAEITIAQQNFTNSLSAKLTDILKAEVVPTYSYHIDNIRDTSSKLVYETKDLLAIAATAPVTFTDIVVYDPRTNTNVQVNANVKEKNAIAVVAQASAPLEFNTSDGQTIRLKDYEYKVVQAAYGNTQLVIYSRQPEIKLDRSTSLYATEATKSMVGVNQSMLRAQADKLSLESVLPLISASSSISLKNYNEQALRDSYDPTKMRLELSGPQTSAVSAINLQGYNEQQSRAGRVKDLDRLNNFGSFMDRAAKPNPMLRG